jgi:hypothetical protein
VVLLHRFRYTASVMRPPEAVIFHHFVRSRFGYDSVRLHGPPRAVVYKVVPRVGAAIHRLVFYFLARSQFRCDSAYSARLWADKSRAAVLLLASGSRLVL